MSLSNSASLPLHGGFYLKGLGVLITSLILTSAALDQVTVVYSPSDSLPYRTFLELKHIKPQLGQYAYFESPWYGGRVIKKIVGREGDELSYDRNGSLWVGKQKIGKAQSQSRDGRQLTPIRPGVIPKGRVFVEGEHERSFDSRYEELGLIPETALGGRVFGLV